LWRERFSFILLLALLYEVSAYSEEDDLAAADDLGVASDEEDSADEEADRDEEVRGINSLRSN